MRSLFFLLLLASSSAQAREYDLYRPDWRFKGGFCSAIGGACAADEDLVTGIFENPAALTNGDENWDFDGDYSQRVNLEPGTGDRTNRNESVGILGLGYSTGRFGFGGAVAARVENVDGDLTVTDAAGTSQTLRAHDRIATLQVRLPFAYQLTTALSLGATVSFNHRREYISEIGNDEPSDTAVSGLSVGLTLGAQYAYSPRLRFGTWFRFPTHLYESVLLTTKAPAPVINYREDVGLHNPWIWALGTQVSVGEASQLYGEADFIGATRDAFQYAFTRYTAEQSADGLRRKGRRVAVEPHLGYRTSLGKSFRLHLGTFYETSRSDGIAARVHGSAGVSFEVFKLFDLIVGIDVARKYSQLILTFR